MRICVREMLENAAWHAKAVSTARATGQVGLRALVEHPPGEPIRTPNERLL